MSWYLTIGVVLVLGGLGWLLAAWRAGLLAPKGTRVPGPEGDLDPFSRRKRVIQAGRFQVAVVEAGEGEPVLLLHGCPFHSYEWHRVFDRLAAHRHVIAPDLLGLGDTPVGLDDDYQLPVDVEMVLALLDTLGIDAAHIVGHDHGGATLQLLINEHPERVRSATLTNAEAYDQWPSKPELPYLRLIVWRLTTPLLRLAMKTKLLQREAFASAFARPKSVENATLDAFLRPLAATPARWMRLVRFFTWQLDPANNGETLKAVPGLKRFHKPTLILWGQKDTNFGPAVAERLAADLPEAEGVTWMAHSAHLPMLEEPQAYTAALEGFFDRVEAEDRPAPGGDTTHAQAG